MTVKALGRATGGANAPSPHLTAPPERARGRDLNELGVLFLHNLAGEKRRVDVSSVRRELICSATSPPTYPRYCDCNCDCDCLCAV